MKRILTVILCLLISLSTCACAAKSAAREEYAVAETAAAAMGAPGNMAYAKTADSMVMEEAAMEMPDNGYEAGATGADGSTAVQDPGRKLIKTVNLEIETKAIDETTAKIEENVAALGGYIENSNVSRPSEINGRGGYSNTFLSCRIPVNRLDEFVASIEGSGNVRYKSESVEDITLSYADTESRKNSLLNERERLNELMKRADTVEDLITIESRLSEVNYHIESIESRLRTYDNQVEYSTVTVNIEQVVEYTPQKTESFGERLTKAVKRSASNFVEFLQDTLIWLIEALPVLIFLGVVIFVMIKVIKAVIMGAEKRKAAKKAKKEAKLAAAAGAQGTAGIAGNAGTAGTADIAGNAPKTAPGAPAASENAAGGREEK